MLSQLSHILDEYPFEITVDNYRVIQFTELRIKKEHFQPCSINPQFEYQYSEILGNSGTIKLKEPLKSIAYSLNIETVACSNNQKKGVPRVCLVDDLGNRVIDTLVSPQPLADGEKYIVKEGLKQKIFDLA